MSEHTERSGWRGVLSRNAVTLLLAVALVAAVVVCGARLNATNQAAATQRQEIFALEAELAGVEQSHEDTVAADVAQALGVSTERVDEDTEELRELVEVAFTWDSGRELEEARETLMRRWQLDPEGDFLTRFLPPARFNEDTEGRRYYYIDSVGLVSRISGSPQVGVIEVEAGTYRYAVVTDVLLTAPVADSEGTTGLTSTARQKVLLEVTIDGQGRLGGLSGVPASGIVRTSG